MNEGNLVSLADRTTEEKREIAIRGGIASGEARREKKLMKDQIKLLLSLPLKDKKAIKQLETLGIDTDNIDNQMALVISMWQTALKGGKGSVAAATFLRDTVGEKPVEEVSQTLNGEITTKQKNAIDDVIKQMKPLSDDDV